MKTLAQVFSAIQMGITNNKPSDDSEVPMEFIQAKADEVRATLIAQYLSVNGVVPSNCIRIHDDVPIDYTEVGGENRYYFTLPVSVLLLPRDKGIFEVWNNARTEPWYPFTSGEYRIMRNIRFSRPSATYPCYQRQGLDKVELYFGNKDVTDYVFSLGLVHLTTDAYADTDEYPIPHELEKTLIDTTIAVILQSMQQGRMDNANDSSDVRTVANP